jgi:heme ABC exporter ATP-binding subunit CcmA
MANHERAITTSALGRRFGLRWVLRGVSFELGRTEVAALVGPNGSGKSTILRVIGTLLRPTTGSVIVDGFDVALAPGEVRARVGYLAHSPGLYDDLTARENLRFAADMLGEPHARAEAALEQVGLAAVASDRVRGFSAGMQRRLAIARLVLRRPRILLLDEPYSNLDSEGVVLMNEIIAGVVRDGGAALLALHELTPAEPVLTRILSLVDGRIAASPPLAGVR